MRIRRTFFTRRTRVKKRKENREEWQQWRRASIKILQNHIESGTTDKLLREPPTKTMKVSPYVSVQILKKAMSLSLFLNLMHDRDLDTTHFKEGDEFARDLAAKAGTIVWVGKLFVYVVYLEW